MPPRHPIQGSGGGSSGPAGSDTQVQFNDGGAAAGNASLTFDKTTGVLSTKRLAIVQGAVTDVARGIDHSVTWNDAADTHVGGRTLVTDTASHADSVMHSWEISGGTIVQLRKDGRFQVNNPGFGGLGCGWGAAPGALQTFSIYSAYPISRECVRFAVHDGNEGTTMLAPYIGVGGIGASDVAMRRVAASIVGFTNHANDAFCAVELTERTDPSAPTNALRLYAKDVGGKTALMVLFPTGAAIQVAIEA